MNDKENEAPSLQRTVLDADEDTVKLGAYIPPLKCGGCGERVNKFYRYDRADDAQCTGCGSEWKVLGNGD